MTNALAGKIAVVTGATEGGIGHACAIAMLEAGARVVPVARNLEKLKATFAKYGDAAIPVAADLLKQEERATLIEKILGMTGQIDIFHANAGAYIGGNLHENDLQEIEDVVILNTLGALSPIRAVLPHMYVRGTGDVVVTGSIAGDSYNPYHEHVYGPSKTFIEQAVKLLRPNAAKQGVRVSAISPGPTETPLVAGWDPERLANARAAGEFISPAEVADALMFVLTRPNGQAIPKMVVTPKAFSML